MLKQFVAVVLFLVTVSLFITTNVNAEEIDANTLQGLTYEAFVSTNDFENLKITIDRLKSNAESCADSIVDLQLGLSSLSHDERIIREKDLQRIINDYSNISSELVSISSVEGEGNRAQTLYALQSDLEALEAELSVLKTYVQTYLGHLKAQDEKWYFTIDGSLLGSNITMTASNSIASSMTLIGQTFQVKKESIISGVRLKVDSPIPPFNNVFISPYHPTITTNTFTYSHSISDEGNFTYRYGFNNYFVSTNIIYIFGVRSRNSSPHINLKKCEDSYSGTTNCLWTATGTRYSLDALKTYDLTAQPNYDLCFDIDFVSQTNIIMGTKGIEIQNDAHLRVNGQNVATVPELNSKIANATQSIYLSLSNFVFGTSSIADNSITANKLASNAVITVKINDAAVTTRKIADGAITESKISTNAVTATKIENGAVITDKIADRAITGSKISVGTVMADNLGDGIINADKLASGAVTEVKIQAGAVTADKINNGAVTADKIATGSITTTKISNGAVNAEKIAANSVSANKIVDGAISTAKIADDSITEVKISQDYRNVLITKYGGSITGNFLCAGIAVTNHLSVSEMTISGNGDWLVGNENNPSDIVINNSEGKITAPEGDLTLLASSNGKIVAESFLQMDSLSQSGVVVIPFGEHTSTPVVCQGITSDAIILLTPRQDCEVRYWVEIDVNNSSFKVKCNEDATLPSSVSFNYFIVRK